MMNPTDVEVTRLHNRELLQESKRERLVEQTHKARKSRRSVNVLTSMMSVIALS